MKNLLEKLRELHIETIASVLILVMAFLMLSGALFTSVALGRPKETVEAAETTETEDRIDYVRKEEFRRVEKPSRNMRTVTLTVSFDQNYGEEGDITVFSGKYYGGTMESNGISAPEPDQRTGYEFVEWRDSAGNPFSSTETVEKDMMYYGVWTEDPSPTVTYHANGGRFRGGPYTDLMPAKVQEGSILVERDWDIFSGWNTAWDGSGETYQPGDTIDLDKKVTLYAQWNGLRLLTFVPNGGKFTEKSFKNPVKVELGKTIEAPKIEKLGYTFAGWYESEVTPIPYDFNVPVTRDAVLYARWVEDNTKTRIGLINGNTLIGVFELSGNETSLGKATNGKSYSSLKPKKSKYSLYGWYTSTDGKGVMIVNSSGSIVGENLAQLPAPDETKRYTPLYACWESSSKQNAVDLSGSASSLASGKTYLLSSDETVSKVVYRASGEILSDEEGMSSGSYFDITSGKKLGVVADSPVSGKSKTWIATSASEAGDEHAYFYLSSGASSSASSLYLVYDGEKVITAKLSDLSDVTMAKWYLDETGSLRSVNDGFLNYNTSVKDKTAGNNPLSVDDAATSPVKLFEVTEQTVYTFSK